MADTEITIRTDTPFKPARLFRAWLFGVGLILPGHFLESPALEWLGFFTVVFVSLVVVPANLIRRNKGLTFDQARERISELEKETS